MSRIIWKCIVAVCLLGCALQIEATALHVEMNFSKNTNLNGMLFYLSAADEVCAASDSMVVSGNKVSSDVETSKTGFYHLIAIVGGGQVEIPLYAPVGTTKLKLKMVIEDNIYPIATDNADCAALSRMAHSQGMLMRKLWTETLSVEQIKVLMQQYQQRVYDADPKGKASVAVKRYLNISAYSNTYLNISNLPQILQKKPNDVNLRPNDVLPSPHTVLDDELATLISYNAHIIAEDIHQYGDLSAQLSYLYCNYHTLTVQEMVCEQLLSNYISHFDYEHKYAEGLTELKQASDKFHLSSSYLNEFQKRVSSISGASFPEGFKLLDKEGNAHSISEFRGKYVYVDFWASWCVPCCREVPYLQKMEKDVNNPDIVFLSISIDSTKEPWLKKMETLQMDGNQWVCDDPKLCQALNIQGIPMFLIYNKEGRLLQYDAPRPSTGDELRTLLDAL